MPEPLESFAHANLKIQWAHRHINDLNHFSAGFISAKPYSVKAVRNDNGVVVIKTGLPHGIPAQIPLFTGDVVHALRSALDYCWMGLERSVCGATAKKKTFPFGEDSESLKTPVSEACRRWSLPQIEKLIFHEIKPFKTGNRHLWNLNRLDNRDKHNLLVTSLGKLCMSSITATADDGSVFSGDRVTLTVGEEINLAAIGSPGDEVRLDYRIEAPVEIVITELGVLENEPLIPTLTGMAQSVSEAVKLFGETFA